MKGLTSIARRLLHARRHRRARRQLSDANPKRILVVCHGNICRSPYLEAELRQLLPDRHIASAGFVGAGRTVPENGLQLARRRGLDLTSHRSRLLTRAMIANVDFVIVMDETQSHYMTTAIGQPADRVIIAGDLDPVTGDREVRDPWMQPMDVFAASYERLRRCAAAIAEALGTHGDSGL